MTRGPDRVARVLDDALLLALLAAALVALLATPTAAVALHSGRWHPVDPAAALGGWVDLVADERWRDPARAFGMPERRWMPGPAGWWATVGWLLALYGLIVFAVARRIDRVTSAPALGRRWFSPRWRATEVVGATTRPTVAAGRPGMPARADGPGHDRPLPADRRRAGGAQPAARRADPGGKDVAVRGPVGARFARAGDLALGQDRRVRDHRRAPRAARPGVVVEPVRPR